MANSQSSYLNAAAAFDNVQGAQQFPTEKLSKEVGRINDLGGSTGFTKTTDLQKKQAESTDGGCGTSYTTATDPKNISVKHDVNGNFVEVATVNEQGDVQKKWLTSSGTSMTFAEDGSVIFTTSKREGDPNTGRFDCVSQGSTRMKIGESLIIVVENKNKVIAGKDAAKEGPAMSIVVYGNIDITSVSGELNVKGKNINLNAESELKLSAGSKISLLSGKGKGQNQKQKTSTGTKAAKVEYGGVSQGSTRMKIGESLIIVVENKNKVIAGKDAAKEGPAMSIVVYGNIDITSVSGELNVKGKNINLNAESELKLSAGSKISLLSGKGKGQNQKQKTSTGTKAAKVEYGGVIEMQSGDLVMSALTMRKTSSMDYTIVEAEGATLSTNKLANYGFQSPGSFTLDITGDLHEKIGGLKRTEILNKAPSTSTIFPGQKDGWLVSTEKVSGHSVNVKASQGGLNFETTKGDISLYTQKGGWIVSSGNAGAVAGIDVDKTGTDGKPLKLNPGVYLRGYKKDVYIDTTGSKLLIGLGDVSKGKISNGISISQPKLEIKNTTGIFLN